MKEAKRAQINDQVCKQVQLMRKGGANQTEIGKLLGLSSPTISRIEKAGFDYRTYLANKRLAREKETAAKKATVELVYDPSIAEEYRREQAEKKEEEQVPGQLEMELTTKPAEEQDRIVKLMRFQAHEMDLLLKRMSECFNLIIMKTDRVNDTLSMILRAMRRE